MPNWREFPIVYTLERVTDIANIYGTLGAHIIFNEREQERTQQMEEVIKEMEEIVEMCTNVYYVNAKKCI